MRAPSFVAFLAVVLTACAAARTAPAAGDPTTEIPRMLQSSAAAWNSGDLEGFLDDYMDNAETAFIGSTVTYGVPAIRARYKASYWKTGTASQKLAFDEIRIRPLGSAHAIASGRYILTNPATGAQEATGRFSLVLESTARGWKIIHDHSS